MPTIEIAGKQIETTEMGYLVNSEDWSEDLAKEMASMEKLELTSFKNSSSLLLWSTTTVLQNKVSVLINPFVVGFDKFIL